MRIGGRLLALLAVPLLGLLSLTGFGVYTGARDQRAAADLEGRTKLALVAFDLAGELETQRSSLIESGGVNPESIARVKALRDQIETQQDTIPAQRRHQATTALAWVDGAERVSTLGLSDDAAIATMSPAINSVLSLASQLINPNGLVDGRPASTTDNLARAQAASAEEYDRLRVISVTHSLDADQFQLLIGLAAAQRSYLSLAQSTAPDDLGVRIERVSHGIVGADPARQAAYKSGAPSDFDTWQNGIRPRSEELSALRAESALTTVAQVDRLAAQSRILFILAIAAALLTVVVTIVLRRRALRSIAKPLEYLASRAETIANVDLPSAVKALQDDPEAPSTLPRINVGGTAEVGEVASAFNDIQDTALRLAGEQAALRVNQAQALTNLGRRNQTLLARQLNYLSTLETDETDPAFLEHLFKLDHLASRMRRNAESLLILAGTETPRIRRKPAKVTEVIRAAMSEVEDFERVRIGNLRDDTLMGPVVIDVIHLLAELIENGLSFSPPGSSVVIEGGPLTQGGYQFAVVDQGVGMAEVELIAANKRLAGRDELEGMPTRYLGQYVVAKLALKTGAIVMLQPGVSGRGVSALVTLPASAMMNGTERPAVGTPRPGTRESRSSGPEPFAPGAAFDTTPPPPFNGNIVDVAGVEAETMDQATFESEVFDLMALESLEGHKAEPSPFGDSPQIIADGVSDLEIDRVFGADRSQNVPSDPPGEWWSEPLVGDAEPPVPSTEPSTEPQLPENSVSGEVIEAFEAAPVLEPTQALEGTIDDAEAGEPAAAPDQTAEAEPVLNDPAVATSRPATPEPASSVLGSSLQRRVPGASLANRKAGPADAPEEAPERSADQVRSRLASFQAGRSRGRGEPQAPSSGDFSNPDGLGGETAVVESDTIVDRSIDRTDSGWQAPGADPGSPFSQDSESSKDWRSSQ